MRLKLYSAPTMAGAMELMRAEMGEQAVVLSAFEDKGRAEVRAATGRQASSESVSGSEDQATGQDMEDVPVSSSIVRRVSSSVSGGAVRAHIHKVLEWHDIGSGCVEAIANAGIRDKSASRDPQSALMAGLRMMIDCSPLESHPGCPIFLFGPPGAGRTTVAARLARRFGRGTVLVNADFRRTGNISRLRSCSGRVLVSQARSPERLLSMVERYNSGMSRVIIDGPSVNPLDPAQMRWLGQIIEVLAVEPVLVMSVEGRRDDMEDAARGFAGLGAGQVIVTRLDMVRRLGSWVSAVSVARLSLAQMSLSPLVSRDLIDAHHGRLARLLLETAPMSGVCQQVADIEVLKGAA